MFICSKRSDALELGVSLNTAWVEFPRPNKIDSFVHNDGDRKSELLSLSLRYPNSDHLPKTRIIYKSCLMVLILKVTSKQPPVHLGLKGCRCTHTKLYYKNVRYYCEVLLN